MDLEIVHGGGAVAGPDGTWRLKDLLAVRAGGAPPRIRAAQLDGPWLRLALDDGSRHAVLAPGARADEPHSPARALLVHDIGQLLTFDSDEGDGLGLQRDTALLCVDGRVALFGEQALARAPTDAERIDARGALVTPGLIDPHTHPIFAGDRAVEFGMKAQGKTYLEIHKAGGGLYSTVRATRAASTDELARAGRRNLDRLLRWGVTTIEGKSGYALETEGELRMLEALRLVADTHPVDVEPTLLGAHAVPPEHKESRDAYIDEIVEQMIPRAARGQLARWCDAYCEDGAFTRDEVQRIFEAARAHGLGLRLHAEQFTDQRGAQLAAELGAASADHLEAVSDDGIAAMAAAGTVAILLPGAALTCRCPWPPARALAEAGVPIALGTDLNPGSSMTASLPLMMSLACTQMRMSCEEAWRAVTIVAARSLGLDDVGVLRPGARADLVIFDAQDYRVVPYFFGDNHARVVIKDGRVVVGA
ncbi:MAG: imidazolonepropionase [Myxococcales bacterium]|nr:imidazolonepropionase [Myxococcales bacterium]